MTKVVAPGLLLFAITIISGCGADPTPLFSNTAQTWTFQNGYGDISTVEILPVNASHSIWHYTKTATRAYWQPGVEAAELWFYLERDQSGNWYSTGGVINMPFGAFGSAPVNRLGYRVTTKDGQQRPYLILPSRPDFTYSTLFDDTVPGTDGTLTTYPNLTWKTSSYIENVTTPVYSGPAFVTDQWEGDCVHEKWYFAQKIGLVKVAPLYCGGPGADPMVTMVRIH